MCRLLNQKLGTRLGGWLSTPRTDLRRRDQASNFVQLRLHFRNDCRRFASPAHGRLWCYTAAGRLARLAWRFGLNGAGHVRLPRHLPDQQRFRERRTGPQPSASRCQVQPVRAAVRRDWKDEKSPRGRSRRGDPSRVPRRFPSRASEPISAYIAVAMLREAAQARPPHAALPSSRRPAKPCRGL
jgi:hypothetical protein